MIFKTTQTPYLCYMKRLSVFLYIVFLPLFSLAQNHIELMKKGDSLIEKGNLESAILCYSQAMLINPTYDSLYSKRAYAFSQKGALEQMKSDLLNGIKINPKHVRFYRLYSYYFSLKNNFDSAMIYINKAIEMEPLNNNGYLRRAEIYMNQNLTMKAKMDIDKAIQLSPNDMEGYTMRGYYFYIKKMNLLAKKDYYKAKELNPSNAFPYYWLSKISYEEGNLEDAKKYLIKADSIKPNDDEIIGMLGDIYYELKDTLNSIKYYTQNISLDPNDPNNWMKRATAFRNFENMDSSCLDIQQAIQRIVILDSNWEYLKTLRLQFQNECDTNQPGYYYQKGIAYYNLQQYSQAIDIYNKGLIKFPNFFFINHCKGNAYMMLGKFQEAIAAYRLMNLYMPASKQDLNIDIKFKNLSETDYKSFISGTLITTFGSMAEAYIYINQSDSIIKYANKAIDLFPKKEGDFPVEYIYFYRGLAYYNQSNFIAAEKDFNNTLSINPKYGKAYALLALMKSENIGKIWKSKQAQLSFQFNTTNPSLNLMPVNSHLTIPLKFNKNATETYLNELLDLSEKAVLYSPDYPLSYYMRGIALYSLKRPGYCFDFEQAKKMGFIISDEELKFLCK